MRRAITLLLLVLIAPLAIGYATAIRDPAVRRLTVHMADWPAGAAPMRVVLLSDLHVVGPDTPPSRLAHVVAQVNALHPDLVLIAGDFESHREVESHEYAQAEIVAPLRGVQARYGVVAVLGNHDYSVAGVALLPRHMAQAGITLLRNQAVRRGPLTIAGADDLWSDQYRFVAMDRAARALPGPTLVLAHEPDIAAALPPRYGLVLAGHTHCGQISLPLFGPLFTASAYGRRYACGVIREGGQTVVVGAGIGTSIVPLRFWAVPDMWLLTLGR